MLSLRTILFFLLTVISSRLNAKENEDIISLAGNWLFKTDANNIGEREQWYSKSTSFYDKSIKLPGTMDDAGYGDPVKIEPGLNRQVLLRLSRKVSYTGAVWNQKEIIIPANWKKCDVSIFLERVIWESTV